MEAGKVLARLVLHAAIFKTIASYDWLSEHYSLAERYNCADYLEVFFDRAVIFKYGELFANSWAGNANFDCTTSVYSRTKNSGIISVIQKMKFRMDSECVDYIQTSESERKKCGEIKFGLRPTYGGALPPAQFVSKHPGPFNQYRSTYLLEPFNFGQTGAILKRERLVPIGCAVEPSSELKIVTHLNSHAMKQDIEMVMAVTSFRECDTHAIPEGWFNCGYGTCISSKYVNDGIVNCPFGDCIDEGDCENAMDFSPLTRGFLNPSDPIVAQGLPNTMDSRAIRDSSGLNSTKTTMESSSSHSHLPKNDHFGEITAQLRTHNEIMDGIYKLLEIMTGMMINGKFEFGYGNSTSSLT